MDNNTHKQPSVAKAYIQSHKKLLIVVGAFLVVLIISVAMASILLHSGDKRAEEAPALKAGQTTLSTSQYKTLVSQAEAKGIQEAEATSIIQDSLRYREAARRLGITVPTYLIAAQQQTDSNFVYTPYVQLTDYDKARLYPKALYVLVALIQQGGSVATVFDAPYDTATDGEANRVYAEDFAKQVVLYKQNNATDENGKPLADPLRVLLASFTSDENTHFAQGVNKSGVIALTDDGQKVIATDEQFTDASKLPVSQSAFHADAVALIKNTAGDTLSNVTQLTNPVSYIVVHRDAVYKKDDTITSRLSRALQGIGG